MKNRYYAGDNRYKKKSPVLPTPDFPPWEIH